MKKPSGKLAERATVLVRISLRHWDSEFLDRLDALSKRTGKPVATLAVRQQPAVQPGYVFIRMDGKVFGQAVIYHNPVDTEWVHERIKQQGCKLKAIEPNPERQDENAA